MDPPPEVRGAPGVSVPPPAQLCSLLQGWISPCATSPGTAGMGWHQELSTPGMVSLGFGGLWGKGSSTEGIKYL